MKVWISEFEKTALRRNLTNLRFDGLLMVPGLLPSPFTISGTPVFTGLRSDVRASISVNIHTTGEGSVAVIGRANDPGVEPRPRWVGRHCSQHRHIRVIKGADSGKGTQPFDESMAY